MPAVASFGGLGEFQIDAPFAPGGRLTVMETGLTGIGTSYPFDRLQVVGDVRIGAADENGCIKNFGGGTIIGTCSSDVRFKKDVTPFGPVLRALAALQPVHYYWRAAEFPDRHFGDGRAYGLIAQDVEQVLPELVVTQEDGYKAVDYSKLPLLTIQAVKELTADLDATKSDLKELKAENDMLKMHVAELERLVRTLLTTPLRQ